MLPKTAEELAIAAGSQVGPLRRLLLALTTIDICRHCGDDRFEMTAVGQMLRADAPGSLRQLDDLVGKAPVGRCGGSCCIAYRQATALESCS